MRLLLHCRQNHWLLPADLGLGFRIHLKFQSCQQCRIQNLWVIQYGGDDCSFWPEIGASVILQLLETVQPMHQKIAKSMSVKQTWESSILPEGSRPFAILQLFRRHWWLRCKQSFARWRWTAQKWELLWGIQPDLDQSRNHLYVKYTRISDLKDGMLIELSSSQLIQIDPIYSLKGWPFGNSVTHGNRSDIASLRRSKLLRPHIQSLRFQASHCFAVSSAAVPLAVLRHLATADPFRKRWWQCHSWSHCLERLSNYAYCEVLQDLALIILRWGQRWTFWINPNQVKVLYIRLNIKKSYQRKIHIICHRYCRYMSIRHLHASRMELWFIHLAALKHPGFEKDAVPESKADSCCKHSWPEIMDKQW